MRSITFIVLFAITAKCIIHRFGNIKNINLISSTRRRPSFDTVVDEFFAANSINSLNDLEVQLDKFRESNLYNLDRLLSPWMLDVL